MIYLSRLYLLAVVATASCTQAVGKPVNTTSGLLTGHASSWKPLVSEYLGIPYAQPPTSDLRFAAPRPFSGTIPIHAANFGKSCPRINLPPKNATISYESFSETLTGGLSGFTETFSEDCLVLNIWTKPPVGEEKKAVLVWIHGGSLNTGSSRWSLYNGARLADEHDVVVVTLNYRLNILGFPRAEFFEDPNLGFLDQRLAVEWVRDNIEEFGGDSSRITLFGQSAGGQSVDAYLHAWIDDPIVHAFIEESGFLTDQNYTREDASNAWYFVSEMLGCGNSQDGDKTLACMRQKDFEDIINAIPARIYTSGVDIFGPTIDNKTVFGDYNQRRKEGNFIKQPLLIGNTDNEAGLYELVASREKSSGNTTNYPGFVNLIRCGPRFIAQSRTAQHVPAWRYVYAGDYPNSNVSIPGAWHGSEIAMVFGTSELMSHIPNTPEQDQLSWAMSKAWTDFAKDPWYGLSIVGWPIYADDEPTVIRLGGANSSDIAFEKSEKYTEGCPSAPF